MHPQANPDLARRLPRSRPVGARFRAGLTASLLGLVLAGCGEEPPTGGSPGKAAGPAGAPLPGKPLPGKPLPGKPLPAAESHQRMVQVLQRLAAVSKEHHPYLSARRAEGLAARVAALPPGAQGREVCELYFGLGLEEAKLGRIESATARFAKANELLPSANLDPATTQFVKFKTGVAYLRLGETQNCCTSSSAESCIVPIRPGAVHVRPEASREAIRYFQQVLDLPPVAPHAGAAGASNTARDIDMHLAARWLMNIAYMTVGGYPDEVPAKHRIAESAFRSASPFPRFANVAARLGIDSFSLCGGAILDDFDGDGNLDVVASSWHPESPLRMFRNNGDGSFRDDTRRAGLSEIFGGLNINQTDYDNDGDLDILVLRGAWLGRAGQQPNSLLQNQGEGTFLDVTFAAGLGGAAFPTQAAAWADYDNDGDLDLYIANESTPDMPSPSQLFRNNGDGTFVDVAAAAGVTNGRFAKGASWGDVDGDRFPDLYVSNYGEPNRLYRNNRNGTFTDVGPGRRVDKPVTSFPTWFWDYDNDGALDLFVASYTARVDDLAAFHLGRSTRAEPSRLYRGDGAGGFVDVAEAAGLHVPMLPMGANFGDLDNDGFLDFYLGTGDPNYETLMPNLMFWNRAGERFEDVTMAGGFGHLQKGHGIAFGDLDNDGDVDVFEQMGGAFGGDQFHDALFENPGNDNRWIGIKLEGRTSNRAAIGARIHLVVQDGDTRRSIYRHVNSGGSFGANPLRQLVGVGKATKIEVLEVFWPTTGRTQAVRGLPTNVTVLLIEDDPKVRGLRLKPFKLGG